MSGLTIFARLMDAACDEPRHELRALIHRQATSMTDEIADTLVGMLRGAYIEGVRDGYQQGLRDGEADAINGRT